jgi:CRP-like cAMP-binding protein
MVSEGAASRFLSTAHLPELEFASREALLKVLEEHVAPAGTKLLEPGVRYDRVGFLLEGTLEVTLVDRRGRLHDLGKIEAPSLFGLSSYFRSKPPDFALATLTHVHYLTLDHAGHDRLRREEPAAAEQLALAAIHVLADRIDNLDRIVSDELAGHPDDHPRVTEWATFRARLMEDTSP